MNEKTIPALVFQPTHWTSQPNEKFDQKEKKDMLAFNFVNLQSGVMGSFHCENTPEAQEKVGINDFVYSDMTKSPVRLFQLTFTVKEDGMNSYAKFAKIGLLAEVMHYEIKK
jgi:hypothetical protein